MFLWFFWYSVYFSLCHGFQVSFTFLLFYEDCRFSWIFIIENRFWSIKFWILKKKKKQLHQTHGYEIKNLHLRPLDSLLGFSTAGSQGPHCELSHFKTQTCLVWVSLSHPDISMHILRTALYIFFQVLTRRIFWTIKSFFCFWSLPLFLLL